MIILATRRHTSGFTLLELVISAALMSIILIGAYLCLSAGVASQKVIEPRAEIFQNARTAMAMVTADLRSACVLSKDCDFLGMQRFLDEKVEADNLDFATRHYNPRKPTEGDYCQMSYFLQKDRESGRYALWRRRNPLIAVDAMSGGMREVIARGLLGMKLEYYDGFDWYDNWGEIRGKAKAEASLKAQDQYNLTGLPEAVRITLWFDSNPRKPKTTDGEANSDEKTDRPLVFQSVARLNLAGVQAIQAGGDDTSTNAPPSTGSTPGGGNGGGDH